MLIVSSWFHGDLKSEGKLKLDLTQHTSEVEELLTGQPTGTFLIRFSSQQGCFASSFVTPNGKIAKSLIKRVDGGFMVDKGKSFTVYPTLSDLVADYMKSKVFQFPFEQTEASEIKRIMMLTKQKQPGMWEKPYLQIPKAQISSGTPPKGSFLAQKGSFLK